MSPDQDYTPPDIEGIKTRLEAAARSSMAPAVDLDRVEDGGVEVVATVRNGDTAFSIIKNPAEKGGFAIVGFDRRSKSGASLALNSETLRKFGRAIIKATR